jgi:hypothetical protein
MRSAIANVLLVVSAALTAILVVDDLQYWTQQAFTTIKPDGTTVLNQYYHEPTLHLQIGAGSSAGGPMIGLALFASAIACLLLFRSECRWRLVGVLAGWMFVGLALKGHFYDTYFAIWWIVPMIALLVLGANEAFRYSDQEQRAVTRLGAFG